MYYYNDTNITNRKKICKTLSSLICTTPIRNYNDKKRVVLYNILSSLTNTTIAPQSETLLKVNNCDINVVTEYSINQDCTYTVSRSRNTNDGNILWECYKFGEVPTSSKLPLNLTFNEEDRDYSQSTVIFPNYLPSPTLNDDN